MVVKWKNNWIQPFRDPNLECDALHFMLFHPMSHDGWSQDQIQVRNKEDELEFIKRNDGKTYHFK